ncbi:MAG: hypothetical protein IV100_23055 [Myxococcales bacterium]|nr:hypothetical protein [Myxococcales bacterium]
MMLIVWMVACASDPTGKSSSGGDDFGGAVVSDIGPASDLSPEPDDVPTSDADASEVLQPVDIASADDVVSDATSDTCGPLPCMPGEPCDPGCPAVEHVCDLQCGQAIPSGCSCAATCRDDGSCCDDEGAAPDGTHFDCGSSTCGDCSCIPKCDGTTCSDGCGGTCSVCDDADDCSVGDTCTRSGCVGAPRNCDDGNVCTSDGCEAASGCTHSPTVGPCSDGHSCTSGDTCIDGVCSPNLIRCTCAWAPPCDDGDPCTHDDCVPESGLCHAESIPCDDGNPCTFDSCVAGTCVHDPLTGGEPTPLGCPAEPCRLTGASCLDGIRVCTTTSDPSAENTLCDVTGICTAGACVPAECNPGETRCITPTIVQSCESSGFWAPESPCGADASCVGNDCVAKICTPLATQCVGNAVAVCDAQGTGWKTLESCATPTPLCIDATCVAAACPAGAVECADELARRRCALDQLSWVVEPCTADERCTDGVCKLVVCDPGDVWCDGFLAYSCDSLGVTAAPTVDCAQADQTCSDGSCVPRMCEPGVVGCAGLDARQTCTADGLGWDVVDCASGESCEAGLCRPRVCVPGATRCDTGRVLACTTSGLKELVEDDCLASGRVCDQATCVEPVCVPGAADCTPDGLRVCDANALGHTTIACAAGQECVNGGCRTILCPAGMLRCFGRQVIECRPDGQSFDVIEDCSSGLGACSNGECIAATCTDVDEGCVDAKTVRRCSDDATGFVHIPCAGQCVDGACAFSFCTPGTSICIGNDVHTCNAQGTGFGPGVSCQPEGVCSVGRCVDVICTPGETFCSEGILNTCNESGTQWWPSACATGQFCIDGACIGAKCKPDSTYCFGTVVTQCDSTGALATPIKDCASEGRKCSFGECADTVCVPGTITCIEGKNHKCNATGSSVSISTCLNTTCSLAPSVCDPATGYCVNTTRECDDGDPCTTDSCGKAGCTHAPTTGGRCVDGNPCTEIDTCIDGVCTAPVVATVSRVLGGAAGYVDGLESEVLMKRPREFALSPSGSIIFADTSNHRVREWRPGVGVTTVAGAGPGDVDGPVGSALLPTVLALAVTPDGAIYIASSNKIKRIHNGMVTTIVQSSNFGAGLSLRTGPDGRLWYSDYYGLSVLEDGKLVKQSITGLRGDFGWNSKGDLIYTVGGEGTGVDGIYRRSAAGEAWRLSDNTKGVAALAVLKDDSVLLMRHSGTLDRLVPGSPPYQIAGGAASTSADGTFDEVGFSKDAPSLLALPDGTTLVASGDTIRSVALTNFGCDDGIPCTLDSCDGAACVHSPMSDGVACDDGDACTSGDACSGQACVGAPFPCQDGDVCTTDYCDTLEYGCRFAHNSAPCNDGSACNTNRVCLYGQCTEIQAELEWFAGGTNGYADGPGVSARFGGTLSLAMAKDGALIVADRDNQAIRRVGPDGYTTTLSRGRLTLGIQGIGGPGWVTDVAVLPSDEIVYTSGKQLVGLVNATHRRICGVTSGGGGDTCDTHVFGGLGEVVFRRGKGVSFLDPETSRIWTVDLAGQLILEAGDGTNGFLDGPAAQSRLRAPTDLAVAGDGALVFVDGNHRVGRIADGVVSTIAGLGTVTTSPTTPDAVNLSSPTRISVDPAGALLVRASSRLWRIEGNAARTVSQSVASDIVFGTGGTAYTLKNWAINKWAGWVRDCDDMNACTVDSCGADTGECSHVAGVPTSPCDDGNPCTLDERCSAEGACVGTLVSCDDGVACTDDVCEALTGKCIHDLRHEPCGTTCGTSSGCSLTGCSADAVRLHLSGWTQGVPEADGSSGSASFFDYNAMCADASGTVYLYRETTSIDTPTVFRRITPDGTVTTLPKPPMTSKVRSVACGASGLAAIITENGAFEPDGTGWKKRVSTSSGAYGTYTTSKNTTIPYLREVSVQADGRWLLLDHPCSNCKQSVDMVSVSPGGLVQLVGSFSVADTEDASIHTWSDAPDGTFVVQDNLGRIFSFDGTTVESLGVAPIMYQPKFTQKGTLYWSSWGLHELSLNSRSYTVLPGQTPIPRQYGPVSEVGVGYNAVAAGVGRFVQYVDHTMDQVFVPTPACDDMNSCTGDVCNGSSEACGHVAVSGSCDDGDPCTQGDTCSGGNCDGVPVDCGETATCVKGQCVTYFDGTTLLSPADQRQLNSWTSLGKWRHWTPCYAASGGGSSYDLFSACKGSGPSLIVLDVTSLADGRSIIGAYQALKWGTSPSSTLELWVEDSQAFLFSLTKEAKVPVRTDLWDTMSYWQWYLKPDMKGPQWGTSDLVLAKTLDSGTSALGGVYSVAGLGCTSCSKFLTGSDTFYVNRIEVFVPTK